MKILRVIASMDPKSGGPCQGIRNTVEALRKWGVENEVVCLDPPESAFIKTDNFTIHGLGPASNSWVYSKDLVPWLVENIRKYDAVIVHGLWLYHSYAMLKGMRTLHDADLKGSEVPWYVMPHGMLDPYFQNAPDRRVKAIRNRFYWKFIERKVVEAASGLLFTCQQELLLAREPFKKYRPAKEINVGYGILPPPPFAESMKSSFRKYFKQNFENGYFLFLSRIHQKKGVDNLIQAYRQILEKGRTYKNKIPDLVIAGPGLDTAFGESLQKMVNENNLLQSKVHFPGMLSGDAKWGAFYGCEAFVLPSHQENFGIAVAEALACETPVLISDKINIWREISEAGGGIIGSDTRKGTYEIIWQWLALSENEKQKMRISATLAYTRNFKINENIIRLINALWPNFAPKNSQVKNA